MDIELFANPRKKDKTQNGGFISTALPVTSLGSTDIFTLSTPYDAIIERESWAHFHFVIHRTAEPLPNSLYLESLKDSLNLDAVEIVVDAAVYEIDIDKVNAVALAELEIDISTIADTSLTGSFWLRRTAHNTDNNTPSSLLIALNFKTK